MLLKAHCVVLEGIVQAIVWYEQTDTESHRPQATHSTDGPKYGETECGAWRRAYQQALLRWHPDKMLHR